MDSFIFKGISSTDFNGIVVNSLPPISKPPKRVNKIQIDGRDGDITEFLGYDSYEKEIEITVLKETNIDELIKWLNGKGTLVLSNEPDKCYEAEIINQIDFSRLEKYEKNKIKFHCQPFKHLLNETELKKENLSKTTSGTSIDLNDSAEMRCELKISGNSKQETRSGKNLLPNNATALTKNGITFTVNEDKSITVNGTATAQTDLPLFGKYDNTSSTFKVNGTITYGLITNNDNVQIHLVKNGTQSLGFTNSSSTLILNEDTNINYVVLRVSTNSTISNQTFYPMIVQGDSFGTYEPYGASPSPDYPSEVECCGDNINLFDKDNANVLSGVFVDGNGYLNSNNKTKSLYIPCKKNTTYSISKILSSVLRVATTNQLPKLYLQGTLKFSGDTSEKCTITTSETDTYIVVYYYNSSNDTLTEQQILNSIKIVEGTETGGYSPYGQGCINEVICNKNIFDGELESGALYTDTGKEYINNDRLRSKYILISPNTNYCFNINDISSTYNMIFFDKNKKFIVTKAVKTKEPFTSPNNAMYLRFYASKSILENANIQLEEGTTATSYIEHKEQVYTIPTQQPFRSVGNTRDTFIKKNNKWYERHNIKEVILTGDENWTQRNQGDGTNTVTFNINLLNVGAYGSNNVLCDKFVYEQNSASGNEGIGFESILVTQYIQINRNRLSSPNLEGFKAWLSNNNIKLYYVLKIPEEIECTEEQSTILFDIEQNAKTYKNVTHIYSTDEISPVIDVTYYLDNRLTITNAGNTESKPVIKIYGKDDIYMYLNDIQVLKIELGNEEYITIDTEKMEAYKDTLDVLKNRLVTGNYDNILLKQGQNILYFEGKVSKVEVSNYSRWT